MDPLTLAGLCGLLAAGQPAGPRPPDVVCPPVGRVQSAPNSPETAAFLVGALTAPSARDAIARVAYAEAGNQGDSGLAAVVFAILNRLGDGRWGLSVDAVVNSRGQFEPVMRAGGDWRGLAPVSAAAQARIDTILNLVLDGRLPDLTRGARYFQNRTIVARRARDGGVSAHLVDFGGAAPSAVIGAHRFYTDTARGGGSGARSAPTRAHRTPVDTIVPSERSDAGTAVQQSGRVDTPLDRDFGRAGDPAQAMFVGSDGVVRAEPR